jgi:hypothetical protein
MFTVLNTLPFVSGKQKTLIPVYVGFVSSTLGILWINGSNFWDIVNYIRTLWGYIRCGHEKMFYTLVDTSLSEPKGLKVSIICLHNNNNNVFLGRCHDSPREL